MEAKTKSRYEIKNIFGFNKIKTLSLLTGLVCFFCLVVIESRAEYTGIIFLPLSFFVVSLFFDFRRSVKGLGSLIIYVAYFLRFTVFPVIIACGGYVTDYPTEMIEPYFNGACAVMIIELVAVFILLTVLGRRSLKRTATNAPCAEAVEGFVSGKFIKAVIALFLLFNLFMYIRYPSLFTLYWRIIFIRGDSVARLYAFKELIDSIPGYLYYPFKLTAELLRYLIAAVLVVRVNRNKKTVTRNWVLTLLIAFCAFSVLSSEQINSVIIAFCIAYYMLLKYRRYDRIIVIAGLTAIFFAAAFFFIKIANVSDVGSLGRILNNYFNGPLNTALSMHMKNNYAAGLGQAVKDFFNAIPVISGFAGANTSLNDIYGSVYDMAGAIMPMAGCGYYYLGYLGCWLPAALVVCAVNAFDELLLRKMSGYTRIILFICIVHAAICVFMYNIGIFYYTWIYTFIPLLIIVFASEQVPARRKQKNDKGAFIGTGGRYVPASGGRRLASNIALSIAAQIISLLVSFILNLIVPKLIDEYQYSYWQTFILYLSYTGVFHFGLLDGIALRYSQYDYDQLDKPRLRSQFRLLLFTTSAVTFIMTVISLLACKNETQVLLILFALAIIIDNQFSYTSYSFQITNRIKHYVAMTLCYRLIHVLIVIMLLLCGVSDFYWYCISDLLGKACSIGIFSLFNKELYCGRAIKFKEALKEYKTNILCGIAIMISGFSASLLLGGAKMVIQWRWDELVFGKVSFAFSLSNIFLSFVTAVSIVLFPSLKRMNTSALPSLYKNIRNGMSPLLFFALLTYFPGCWILSVWLPKYSESLAYLGILLPIIIYLSKVSLLTNNYLKAYRKEKLLFAVNVCSAALGIILFVLSAYVFNNLILILCSVVFVVMLNSAVSEILVARIINTRLWKDIAIEFIMTVGFILCASLLSRWIGLGVYGCLVAAYCGLNYKEIKKLCLKFIRKKRADS